MCNMGCCSAKLTPPDIEPYIAPEPGRRSSLNNHINSEFKQLQLHPVSHSAAVGRSHKNLPKNRYQDIVPYDYNRVTLKDGCYINASLIEPNFIATQDPLLTEDSVFWLMVWESNVRTIVRLSTDLDGTVAEDDKQTRCAVYIPTKKWVTDDHLELSLKGTSHETTFTETTVSIKKDGRQLDVKHYHINGWGSSSFPPVQSTLETLRALRNKNHHAEKSYKNKILVHCGAGTGRTGTFIAVWQLTEAWDKGEKKDILAVCKKLREQRVGMISRESHYDYLYQCWRGHGMIGRVNYALV